jgi:hypothetical protein
MAEKKPRRAPGHQGLSVGRVEQVHLARMAAAVLADALLPTVSEANVLAHVYSLGIHALMHGNLLVWLKTQDEPCSTPLQPLDCKFSPQRRCWLGSSHPPEQAAIPLAALFVQGPSFAPFMTTGTLLPSGDPLDRPRVAYIAILGNSR